MKVGDLVRFGWWIKDVLQPNQPKPVGVIMGFDNTEPQHPRVDVLWPSGNRKLLHAGLFEVVQHSST